MREAAIVLHMAFDATELPNDIAVLKALLIVANKRTKDLDAEVETLKLTIAKLQHNRFGASSERTSVLMDQLELQLDELVARRAEETASDEIAAATAAAQAPDGTAAKLPKVRLPAVSAALSCGG